MSEFTQEQLDAAVAEAVRNAQSGMHSKSDVENMIAGAVTEAMSKAKAEHEADKQLALDREKSKREDINNRLKAANKKQVPDALSGLDEDLIAPLIQAAEHIKGMSQEKATMFFQNLASNDLQSMVADTRNKWSETELTPVKTELEAAKQEIASLKATALKARKEGPIRDALLKHCNPDPEAQKDAYRRMWDAFEDIPDEEGNLKAKAIGENLGVCTVTNAPYTPDTYAQHLAHKISYFAKPSSTTKIGGAGDKPTKETAEQLPLSEALKGKSAAEKIAILEARKSP